MSEPILVCVAWPYAKSATHVGQIAGAYLPADIFARYHRLIGDEVLMVSGSDDHGTPIMIDADKEGISPKALVAHYHKQIVEVWERLGISFDLYTDTETPNHYAVAQDIFLKLLESGYIYKDTMEMFYCPTDKRFLPDRYVNGTCPHCGYAEARGDQCDNCGRTLDSKDLINARCKLCGTAPEIRETEHFFFDLPKFRGPLLTWLEETEKAQWRPNVVQFTANWLKEGLLPRAITRDLDWGVPLPLEGYPDKRIYVWFEALIGYLSASKEWAQNQGDPELWRKWWQTQHGEGRPPAKAFYFIGKDNIPFHTIIWPAILLGYGGLDLPYDVPANEFVNMHGAKASTSKGNVIWTLDVLASFAADALRYYLTATAPETHDTNFIWEDFYKRNNNELVATYGNAVNRVLTLIDKNFARKVPQPGQLDERDEALLRDSDAAFTEVGAAIAGCHLRDGLEKARHVADLTNKYLEIKEPWRQIKVDRLAAATTLYVGVQVVNRLKVLFAPYLPFSSQRLHELLGFSGPVTAGGWTAQDVPIGQSLANPALLFAKLDEAKLKGEAPATPSGSGTR